jgi:hypothetical protein
MTLEEDELPSGVEALCEVCHGPAEYDNDSPILCDECRENAEGPSPVFPEDYHPDKDGIE